MDERALRVELVELGVQPAPGLHDRGGVREHAHGARHSREIVSVHDSRCDVVDPDLKCEEEGAGARLGRWKEGCQGQTLKPVGHQSTNRIELSCLMELMALLTSFGTTFPR